MLLHHCLFLGLHCFSCASHYGSSLHSSFCPSQWFSSGSTVFLLLARWGALPLINNFDDDKAGDNWPALATATKKSIVSANHYGRRKTSISKLQALVLCCCRGYQLASFCRMNKLVLEDREANSRISTQSLISMRNYQHTSKVFVPVLKVVILV